MSQISHYEARSTARDASPGSGIAPHRHRQHQVVYPSRGAVSVSTRAGTWVAPPDRAIWVPAGAWHAHRFWGATRFHTVAVPRSEHPEGPTEPTVVAVPALLRELIVRCSEPAGLGADRLRVLRAALVGELVASPEQPLRLPAPRDARLVAACGLVTDDLEHVHGLRALARAVDVGERTLSRLFSQDLGMTYPRWRTQVRLHRALELLAEDRPVTQVARLTGWSSASAFIDAYRRVIGTTPGTRSSRAVAGGSVVAG